jgi:DNA anti-recombination protein RmuC
MEKMGKKIEDAQSEYQKLISTRSKKLESPLQKIADIRERNNQLGLPDSDSENIQ